MNIINISHTHSYDKETACSKADEMLEELAEKYGLSIETNGDGEIIFRGSGISGSVEINEKEIYLFAKLGFLMTAMKPLIEGEIQKKLDKNFS